MLALGANGRGRAGLLSALRPQDVFATSLYTGTGAARSIVNGLDMAGRGGLSWTKKRSAAGNNVIVDTVRGGSRILYPNTTGAEVNSAGTISSFNANGYTLGNDDSDLNQNGATYVNWTLLFGPKFCVEVPYTGDGTSGRVIQHGLGIKPGMIIVKRRDAGGTNWAVWHTGFEAGLLTLNTTNAAVSDPNGSVFGNGSTYILPTQTNFTIGSSSAVNTSGGTYVAYLFAHDPDTTNGIVQCGSYTENGASQDLALGWQPQLFLVKSAAVISDWFIFDAARGFTSTSSLSLSPNTSAAERSFSSPAPFIPKATGLTISGGFFNNGTVVFLAIRAPT